RLTLTQHDYLSTAFRELISALWAISNTAVIRKLAGEDARPIEVSLELARPEREADLASYTSALRCPIECDARVTTTARSPSLLDQKVIGADPAIEAAMLRYVEDVTSRLPD